MIQADETLHSTVLIRLAAILDQYDLPSLLDGGYIGFLQAPVKHRRLCECLGAIKTLAAGEMSGEYYGDSSAQDPFANTPPAPEANAPLRPQHVLVAEDNPVNQKVAQLYLQKMGHRVDIVGNGREAIKALESVRYDVVLMDVQMPEVDGLAATRVIRHPGSDVLDHEVPIIALTAHALPSDREQCLAAGMNDYISKPIDARDLQEALERQLAGAVSD